MLKRKNILILFMVLGLILSGCSKKEEVQDVQNDNSIEISQEENVENEVEEVEGENIEEAQVENDEEVQEFYQFYKVMDAEVDGSQEVIELEEDASIVQEVLSFINKYEEQTRNIDYENYKGMEELDFWSKETIEEYKKNSEKDFEMLNERIQEVKLKLSARGISSILELAVNEDETRAVAFYIYNFVIDEATDEYLEEGNIEKGVEYNGTMAVSLIKEDGEWRILERVENPFNN